MLNGMPQLNVLHFTHRSPSTLWFMYRRAFMAHAYHPLWWHAQPLKRWRKLQRTIISFLHAMFLLARVGLSAHSFIPTPWAYAVHSHANPPSNRLRMPPTRMCCVSCVRTLHITTIQHISLFARIIYMCNTKTFLSTTHNREPDAKAATW